MSEKELIAASRTHGLNGCAELLGRADVPAPAPKVAFEAGVPADHPLAALDGMRRQGFVPALVERQLRDYELRPLERGLFAWDALTGSFIADGKLRDRLRRDAATVAEILPKTSKPLRYVAVRGVDLSALVRKLAVPVYEPLSTEQQRPLMATSALAAIEMLVTVDKESKNARVLRQAAPAYAHLIDLGHASTLASFYLHYLWKRVGDADALVPLLEVLADAGAEGKFSVDDEELAGKTPEAIENLAYKMGRMSARHTGSFYEDIQQSGQVGSYKGKPAAEVAKSFPRSHITYAHLGLIHGQTPVPLEVVNAIAAERPDWRYARRVQAAMVAKVAPPSSDLPLKIFDNFLATFGNVADAWNDVSHYAPDENDWIAGLCARLVREMSALPHDVEAWRAFGPLFLDGKDQDAWAKSIDARIAEQCKL
jgi:hypothetical protein